MNNTILAIESSCDDTAAAVISDAAMLSNVVSSQLDHKDLGGVVPELASRKHLIKICAVVDKALKLAQLGKGDLDAIAFTVGPGLLGSLMVGVSFAKSMALALDIPIIAVNHMKAHVMAHFIEEPRPQFPFICLTVSGGHTELVLVRSVHDMTVIGKTLDDAAGEAFDKSGKLLGLPYPSGPVIDKLAQEGDAKFEFTKPDLPDLDFSFSGLKTNFLRFLQRNVKKSPDFIQQEQSNLCASLQSTIVDILMDKLTQACDDYGIKHVGIAGGVSANSALRQALKSKAKEKGWTSYIPKISHCTDNAAMIAITAHYQYLDGHFAQQSIRPDPRLKIPDRD